MTSLLGALRCKLGFHDWNKYVPPEDRPVLPSGRRALIAGTFVCVRCGRR